jgi:AraC family transcriptional regulator of adaptative response / DNA-3-methyladenine glycosylase II
MRGFLAQRAVAGVEAVDDTHGLTLRRALALPHPRGGECTGWLQARFDAARCELVAEVSESLLHALPAVIARLRAVFDLDADPGAIDAVLRPSFSGGEGLRVPGTFEGFELAVRAVLGQQITVAAARTLAGRLVRAFGRALQTPCPEVHTLFPTATALVEADAKALGALGIVRQRQTALQALARAVADGRLALHPGAPVEATVAQLQALSGIGAWTAQVIAMRALRWPDAFPAGDLALHAALGLRHNPRPARAAETVAQAWRPWRSYAVLRAWAGHAVQAQTF